MTKVKPMGTPNEKSEAPQTNRVSPLGNLKVKSGQKQWMNNCRCHPYNNILSMAESSDFEYFLNE